MSDINTKAKKRSLSIDMVKGLSIMTLFFLHFENGWINYDYNYFVVRSPAFYIVVGWLWGMSSNRRAINEHWAKRKEGLVKPYIWLSLIFLSFDVIMYLLKQHDANIIGRDVFKAISLRGIGTLWFLPALLGGEMLFLYFRDKGKVIRIFTYIIFLSIIVLYNQYSGVLFKDNQNLKFACESIFRVFRDISDAYIYISIAYYMSAKWGKKIFNAKKAYLFFTSIALLSTAFYFLNHSVINKVYFSNTTETVLFILGNCCAGFGILLLFRSIEWLKPLSIPLSYCGRNSLVIMAFHYCLLLQLTFAFDKNVLGYSEYYGDRTIVYFLIATLLQIGIIELVNRKFKFIIGKK